MRSKTLYKTIAVLLAIVACVLLFSHSVPNITFANGGIIQTILGVIAGFVVGIFAAILGVAGGELLIPILILLFGVDIKLAGSLSLAISLPTMLIGFARYSKDKSFTVIKNNKMFVLIMSVGSILGALIGGIMLGFVPEYILLPTLALILFVSSYKIWKHK
ncbi:MAG: sulfite exporter TauE/SafE family protein [Campylobacteraceae bacterium]|nr:sulfite exporter TauE/SafE family protein [Campylobacteraceae bacterium]